MIQIHSFKILLFALNVLLQNSVALVKLTSVVDFVQIWALIRRLESRITSMISSMTTGTRPRSQTRRRVFDQHLRNILCRHAAHQRNENSTNVVQSAFHDLFTWLKLYRWHVFRIVFPCVSSSKRSDYQSCLNDCVLIV